MKLLVLVLAISAWAILLAPAYEATSLNLESTNADVYSNFVTSVRNAARDRTLAYHGIPMMPAPVNPPSYHTFDLTFDRTKTITLAFNRNNLYCVAYQDQNERGNLRAHFFPDAPSNARNTLFTTATEKLTIKYDSTYPGIESKAGKREVVPLGRIKLREYALDVYGKRVTDRTQARFLLVAIQMVAEAARFQYIANQVRANYNVRDGVLPNPKVIELENSWGKVSKGIRLANNTGIISPPLTLKDNRGQTWTVNRVLQIKPDVGLLAYEA